MKEIKILSVSSVLSRFKILCGRRDETIPHFAKWIEEISDGATRLKIRGVGSISWHFLAINGKLSHLISLQDTNSIIWRGDQESPCPVCKEINDSGLDYKFLFHVREKRAEQKKTRVDVKNEILQAKINQLKIENSSN